jgi:hypothetical protein
MQPPRPPVVVCLAACHYPPDKHLCHEARFCKDVACAFRGSVMDGAGLNM